MLGYTHPLGDTHPTGMQSCCLIFYHMSKVVVARADAVAILTHHGITDLIRSKHLAIFISCYNPLHGEVHKAPCSVISGQGQYQLALGLQQLL